MCSCPYSSGSDLPRCCFAEVSDFKEKEKQPQNHHEFQQAIPWSPMSQHRDRCIISSTNAASVIVCWAFPCRNQAGLSPRKTIGKLCHLKLSPSTYSTFSDRKCNIRAPCRACLNSEVWLVQDRQANIIIAQTSEQVN